MKISRTNMTLRSQEYWRPPIFKKAVSPFDFFTANCRRFIDLQAGSLWKDLKMILPTIKGSILDVGCGAQPYRELVPEGVNYLGIDTADANEQFGYEVPNTLYFAGTEWPIDSESFDNILCTETLEHLSDPKVLLLEANRVLKKGGQLIATVPFAARWHYIPHDYWRYTPSSLKMLLGSCGFDSVEVYARGNQVTVACYKVMALFLPLLLPQDKSFIISLLCRLAGALLVPVFLLLAFIANLSLNGKGGDDCLGYTILCRKQE